MDGGALGGMAIIAVGVQVGVLAATRLAVRSAPMRLGLYAISGAALAVTLAGLVALLPAGVTIGAPPVGALAPSAVAIGASVAILWLALRNDWLTNWAGRAGAGLSIWTRFC